MLDADLKRFERGLNQTRSGLRLRLAMHEGLIAVKQIARLQQLNDPRGGQSAVDSWRRAYIKACNHASEAIDTLFNEHQWPEDGARDRRYEYRPKR